MKPESWSAAVVLRLIWVDRTSTQEVLEHLANPLGFSVLCSWCINTKCRLLYVAQVVMLEGLVAWVNDKYMRG